jgi:formamidopyrimidine-DNA glycosylase
MPELPEVEQVRQYLEKNALGHRILSVDVFDVGVLQDIDAQTLQRNLNGRSIIAAIRWGKQMFIGLDDGSFLTVHLGMTGDLIVGEDGLEPKYSRVAFRFEGGKSLFYIDLRKFGAVGITDSVDRFVTDHRIGPDALRITRSDFIERVSHHRRAIKSVLLDQGVLSGIGNLYADEVLFQVRLHPSIRADCISRKKLVELHNQIGGVLRESIEASSDFDSLPNGYLLRARHVGMECPRGNGLLEMTKIGGRTTIFCPECQRPK